MPKSFWTQAVAEAEVDEEALNSASTDQGFDYVVDPVLGLVAVNPSLAGWSTESVKKHDTCKLEKTITKKTTVHADFFCNVTLLVTLIEP